MILGGCRGHQLGLGQHFGRHLFQALGHLFGGECSGLAVDDQRHRLARKCDVAIEIGHAWDAGQRFIGIVGGEHLQ